MRHVAVAGVCKDRWWDTGDIITGRRHHPRRKVSEPSHTVGHVGGGVRKRVCVCGGGGDGGGGGGVCVCVCGGCTLETASRDVPLPLPCSRGQLRRRRLRAPSTNLAVTAAAAAAAFPQRERRPTTAPIPYGAAYGGRVSKLRICSCLCFRPLWGYSKNPILDPVMRVL